MCMSKKGRHIGDRTTNDKDLCKCTLKELLCVQEADFHYTGLQAHYRKQESADCFWQPSEQFMPNVAKIIILPQV